MGNVNGQTAVTELNANAVQAVLEAAGDPQTATVTYPFTISIFENFGRAFVSWQLDPNYAIGQTDLLQLREGTQFSSNSPVLQMPTGLWDTGHDWGTGLNVSYWSWNYGASPGWRQLVVTPNT